MQKKEPTHTVENRLPTYAVKKTKPQHKGNCYRDFLAGKEIAQYFIYEVSCNGT